MESSSIAANTTAASPAPPTSQPLASGKSFSCGSPAASPLLVVAGRLPCLPYAAGGGKASQASALRGWQVPLAVGVGCPGAAVGNLLPWCFPAQQQTAHGGEAAGGATEERSLYLLVSSDRCNSKQGSVGAVVNRAALVQTEMPYWPSCLYVRHVICNKTSKIQIVVMGSKRVITSR